MEDKLIIVSSDSHAGVPKDLWSHYLPERYHELLPQLRKDNEIYPQAIYLLGAKSGASTTLPEVQEAHQVDWHGLHDPVLRLADMDREGVTAELIYHGDFRLGDMFHNVTGRVYSFDAWEDGARGWNRWAADNFGFAMHRFLVTAAIGPCVDMDATVAELEWIADHRFTGTYGPGYMTHRDMPPLSDEYWEPFWSVCEERGIAIVVHAGFGTEFGAVFPEIERIYNDVATAAGSTDPASLFEHEGINTTVAKAKELRPYAEKLVTLARRGDLHAIRQVEQKIPNRAILTKLFKTIGPRFASRPGGYTRIMKLGHRPGDGAEMARIELLAE